MAPPVPASVTMCARMEPALTGAFLELLEATARHAADYLVGPPSYDVLLTLGHMYVSRSCT